MAIDLPILPIPLSARVVPLDFGVSQSPPFGGVTRQYDRLGSRHSVQLDMGLLDATCAGRWIAAKRKAKATGVTVRARFPQPTGLGSTLTGVTVNGASQLGRLLNIGGLPTSTGVTNRCPYSEEMDNASWTKSGTTVTANTGVDGAGATTLDSVFETATTADHYIEQQNITFAGSSYVTHSFEIRALGRRYVGGQLNAGGGHLCAFGWDLTAVTATVGSPGAGTANASASITNLGGGLYRCTMTLQFTGAETLLLIFINPRQTAGAGFESYLGDVTKGLLIGRQQTEFAATASAYVGPTAATALTIYPTIIKAGSAFSVIVSSRSYLYVVTDDLMGSASATGQIGLDGLLRASPANGAALELVNPIIEGWLQGADDWTIEAMIATGFSVEIAEAA
jgi:hypothetical protein